MVSHHEVKLPGVASLSFDPIVEARRQWVSHGWGEPDVMATITSIVRVQQLISAMVEAALRPLDLTFARYEALALLYFTRHGSLPLGKMSERLQVHPTSVTNIIDRLEEQGLVHRIRPASDRRTVLAEIRPSARLLVEEATERLVRDAFSQISWSKSELDDIFKIFARLREEAGDFHPPDEADD